MSDLQCPATIVLAWADSSTGVEPLITALDDLHCAAVQVTPGAQATSWAGQVGAALKLKPDELADVHTMEQLVDAIGEAADLFRGVVVAVITELQPLALGLPLRPGSWVTLDVDGDGWRLKPGTDTQSAGPLEHRD